ncbi:unnamed protein product, partial [Choristocarpus tenellus]
MPQAPPFSHKSSCPLASPCSSSGGGSTENRSLVREIGVKQSDVAPCCSCSSGWPDNHASQNMWSTPRTTRINSGPKACPADPAVGTSSVALGVGIGSGAMGAGLGPTAGRNSGLNRKSLLAPPSMGLLPPTPSLLGCVGMKPASLESEEDTSPDWTPNDYEEVEQESFVSPSNSGAGPADFGPRSGSRRKQRRSLGGRWVSGVPKPALPRSPGFSVWQKGVGKVASGVRRSHLAI